MDRIGPTVRPQDSPIGYQTWSQLTFLHWKVPVAALRPLIPSTLKIDTFNGDAWLGLVPFYMSSVRPWWSPPVPGVSYFCETNLRTYVHLEGTQPGVWFFSLDAANRLAVWIARNRWCLNYYHATMSLEPTADGCGINYYSQRPDGSGRVDVQVQIGDRVPVGWDPVSCDSAADAQANNETPMNPEVLQTDSLEFFLAERYLLYSTDRVGRLYRGQVHHRPYPLHSAQLLRCQQSLTNASGINVADSPDHVLFSPGVTVDIFPLRPVVS